MAEEIKQDAFEAALAASASEIASPSVEEDIEEVVLPVASTEPELALASDEDGDIESDENDPNAEFRRTLRTALGDWYVVTLMQDMKRRLKATFRTVSLH